MKEEIKSLYIRRSQKDYPMNFKLSVVREVESGSIGICAVSRKYGNFDRENNIGAIMVKSQQQKIFELEQKVRLLERQNKFLEQQIVEATDKAGILDKIIEIAEEDFKIHIRKNGYPNSRKYYRAGWSTHTKQSITAQVVAMVLPIRQQMPRIGGKKLYYLLQEPLCALDLGRDKFFDILRANRMLVEPKRQYRTTTDSKHMFRKHKNLVLDYVPLHPEEVWVSDITYIGTRDKHAYLALITDAYSKKVIGYNLSDTLEASGAVRALRMANRMRQYDKEPLIHHSDRGAKYCCDKFQQELKRYGPTISMTESYDP